jgi:hypothetical protein
MEALGRRAACPSAHRSEGGTLGWTARLVRPGGRRRRVAIRHSPPRRASACAPTGVRRVRPANSRRRPGSRSRACCRRTKPSGTANRKSWAVVASADVVHLRREMGPPPCGRPLSARARLAAALAEAGVALRDKHPGNAGIVMRADWRTSAGPPAGPDSTWLRLVPQPSGGLSASRFFRDQPMLEIKGLTWSHRPGSARQQP